MHAACALAACTTRCITTKTLPNNIMTHGAGKGVKDVKLGGLRYDRSLLQLNAPKMHGIDSWYAYKYAKNEDGALKSITVWQASLIGEGHEHVVQGAVQPKSGGRNRAPGTFTGASLLSIDAIGQLLSEIVANYKRSGVGQLASATASQVTAVAHKAARKKLKSEPAAERQADSHPAATRGASVPQGSASETAQLSGGESTVGLQTEQGSAGVDAATMCTSVAVAGEPSEAAGGTKQPLPPGATTGSMIPISAAVPIAPAAASASAAPRTFSAATVSREAKESALQQST